MIESDPLDPQHGVEWCHLQGWGGNSQCWLGLKGVVFQLDESSGASLSQSSTARLAPQVVTKGPHVN